MDKSTNNANGTNPNVQPVTEMNSQASQMSENSQVYVQVQNNPYANLSGYNLATLYNEVMAQKQNIDWQFYYLCLEMQNRLAYIEQNGKDSVPEYYIPTTIPETAVPPKSAQPEKKKIIISDELKEQPKKKGFMMGESMFQRSVDSLVKRLIKESGDNISKK